MSEYKKIGIMEMTGLEIFLLITGIIIMAVSFLFGEQLDKRNSQKDIGLDENEIKSMVKSQVDHAVEEAIDDTVEKTAVELDKLSNEKIMAVSDYSENVLSEINKNHEEVMFLYSMLNDKEEQVKNTVRDVEMVKESVKKMAQKSVSGAESEKEQAVTETEQQECVDKSSQEPETEVIMNNNQKILSMYQQGMSNMDIAKELNLGLGEVRLVIDLYKARGKK